MIKSKLSTGKLVHSITLEGSCEVRLVKLNTGDDIILGIFKPIIPNRTLKRVSRNNKCPQAFREVMAFEVDRLLRINFVPITVLRKFNGTYGSLQYFVEKAVDFVPQKGIVNEMEYYKIGLFDYIIGNTDRNKSNILYDDKPVLIDNGSSFPEIAEGPGLENFVCMPLRFRDRQWKLDDVIEPYDKKYLLEGISKIKSNEFKNKFKMSNREAVSLDIRLRTATNAIKTETLDDLLYSILK